MKKKVAVIGAGMAGLSAAYRLTQAGFDTTIFEGEGFVGGRTRSIEKAGFTLDLGAITLSPAYKETIKLLEDVGAPEILTKVNPVLAIPRGGQLHELDLSKLISTGLKTPLLSTFAKLSLLKLIPVMAKYGSKSSFESMAMLSELDVESCRTFALRKVGKEVHDYLIDPIIRVNMFNATDISSAVDIVWLLKIFSDADLIQVKGGMDKIARQVASRLNVQLNTTITGVSREADVVMIRSGREAHQFDGAVVAVPVKNALEIAPWISGAQRQWFENAKPISSLAIHVGLKRRPNTKAAMIMVPSSEAEAVMGIALEHNKCGDRAPAGKGLMVLHMSPSWADRHANLDETTIAQKAVALVEPFLGPLTDDIEMVNVHRWQHEDHQRPVGIYKALGSVIPQTREGRVTFAGEYISAGIEGAVISGRRCAEALTKTLGD
jgi:protoporphyrinogen/coproporphyrinogen III oxidase